MDSSSVDRASNRSRPVDFKVWWLNEVYDGGGVSGVIGDVGYVLLENDEWRDPTGLLVGGRYDETTLADGNGSCA